jgi:hypothetical protein
MSEKIFTKDFIDASVIKKPILNDEMKLKGQYTAKCYDKNGILKWEDTIENTVMDLGANLALDTLFGGAQNTAYFLGLISSIGYSTIAAANTMVSHSGWNEAGNGSNYPNWSTPASNARATITWNAASARAKAIASSATFVFATNGGTVKGCFIVTGSGAVATNNSTAGTLYSAGLFTGGDKVVSVGDTLNVSYSTSA